MSALSSSTIPIKPSPNAAGVPNAALSSAPVGGSETLSVDISVLIPPVALNKPLIVSNRVSNQP